jgi:uncharacterized protein (DUF2062 family)
MFRRRLPLSLARKIKEMLWPSMGWNRALIYMGHRLIRLKDTTYSLAMGLSVGLAVSFTPMPGSHILQAAAFAWLFRSNILASFIGTLFGNPWTLPLMWWSSYKIGEFSFGITGFDVKKMPDLFTWAHLVTEIKADPLALFLPWLVGGYMMAIISIPISYAVFHVLVLQARARQVQWKQRRAHKAALQITEIHE